MTEEIVLYLLHVLGFAGFLWLGLYALTHGDSGRVATLTGSAAVVTACFFLSGGILWSLHGGPEGQLISRATWWADVAPIALWFHLSLWLNARAAGAPWRRPLLWVAYGLAIVLSLLGMVTNLVTDYRPSAHGNVGHTGPLYLLYVLYLFAFVSWAVFNFTRMSLAARTVVPDSPTVDAAGDSGATETGEHAAVARTAVGLWEVRLLVVGTLFFLMGTGYLALDNLLGQGWKQVPAYILLLAGLGAVGATVAMRSALLLGKDVRRDFLYSFTGLVALLAPYIVAADALLGFGDIRRSTFTLLLAGLITAGHTLNDTARAWLDSAFFTPIVREERAAARAYVEALATPPVGPHPDLATARAFDSAVRRALTHLSDPTKLATSPLLNLAQVAKGVADGGLEDNRLNRAAVLKEILLELLEGLRGSGPGDPTGDARRYYNCLYYPYVRGLGRRRAPTVIRQLTERRRRDGSPRSELEQVLEWLLQVDEDTFYKWQRRGSDTIAAALGDREIAAGGVAPRSGAT